MGKFNEARTFLLKTASINERDPNTTIDILLGIYTELIHVSKILGKNLDAKAYLQKANALVRRKR